MAATTTSYHQPQTLEEVRTLWIGDLQYWVDESYLTSCFAHTREVVSIKIIRNKITGQPEGYGFVEFTSHSAAERVLQTYNGTTMPGTELLFRLNWASFGIGERKVDAGPEHSIFVGDLAPEVTDYMLQELFRTHYPSVRGAKVVTDPSTGRSKGYGFVKFADEMEKNRSMQEMNGAMCSSRPMRISAATPKKTTGVQHPYAAAKVATIYPPPAYVIPQVPVLPPESDPTNTTILIGNLDYSISEEELKQLCLQLGEIAYVNIPSIKGSGIVQFVSRASAEGAIQRLQGTMIGSQAVQVSWGRSPAKQDAAGAWGQQMDQSQWNMAYYSYGQGYDPYSYGGVQDPSSYGYGAYAGYAQYPQQADGMQDMSAMGGAASAMELKDETYDPLAPPDVDRLNGSYAAVHGSAILGRSMWLTTSSFGRQVSSASIA
ncbi:hypothetical protein V2J09_018488 [Rumex salicifolius]